MQLGGEASSGLPSCAASFSWLTGVKTFGGGSICGSIKAVSSFEMISSDRHVEKFGHCYQEVKQRLRSSARFDGPFPIYPPDYLYAINCFENICPSADSHPWSYPRSTSMIDLVELHALACFKGLAELLLYLAVVGPARLVVELGIFHLADDRKGRN